MIRELAIEKLVYGGAGLGRIDGIPIFVPYSLPGDRLEVEIVDQKKDYWRGKVMEITRPGPDRVSPPCPHFGICGGCQWQHIGLPAQTEWKKRIVLESLKRIANIEWTDTIPVHTGPDLGYRNRVQWKYVRSRAGTLFGLFKQGSRSLVAIRNCRLLGDPLNQSQPICRKLADRLGGPGGEMEVVCVPSGKTTIQSKGRVLSGPRALTTPVLGFNMRFSPLGFFQCNTHLLDELAKSAVKNWQGETALDLYAGMGLFSVFLARQFSRVVAVEQNARAAECLAKNCKGEKFDLRRQTVEAWLESEGRAAGHVDLALLDPPRPGLTKAAREGVTRIQPGRIVYVSCNPSTLARDVKHFIAHGYELESMEVLDMFPHTYHIETVVHLVSGK